MAVALNALPWKKLDSIVNFKRQVQLMRVPWHPAITEAIQIRLVKVIWTVRNSIQRTRGMLIDHMKVSENKAPFITRRSKYLR
jgi:hypothetical protein